MLHAAVRKRGLRYVVRGGRSRVPLGWRGVARLHNNLAAGAECHGPLGGRAVRRIGGRGASAWRFPFAPNMLFYRIWLLAPRAKNYYRRDAHPQLPIRGISIIIGVPVYRFCLKFSRPVVPSGIPDPKVFLVERFAPQCTPPVSPSSIPETQPTYRCCCGFR